MLKQTIAPTQFASDIDQPSADQSATDRIPAAQPLQPLAAAEAAPAPKPALVETSPRRIGVELEFAKLGVAEAARIVARIFRGELTQSEPHAAVVESARDGSFKILLDTRHAQKCATDTQTVEEMRRWFGDVASLVVPVEIACPPLPESRLGDVERLIEELRSAGAEGTNAALLYAFGTHLNIEIKEVGVAQILNTLRAYLLLEEWLRAQIDVNPTRSAIGFEARFSLEFQRQVLSPDYQPDKDALIADYVHANPTRNRGLDLLPVLAHLDETAIEALLPQEKASPRPAYHYRLPNCAVDEPSWRIRDELALWGRVEKLAADPEELRRAMERFQLESGWLSSGERAATSLALGERLSRESAG